MIRLPSLTGMTYYYLSSKNRITRTVPVIPRFTTLDALCQALDCQPGDLLEYNEE
ncbi:helix-turn-helix transcriptional regulator [Alkalihalobacillus macyae]|uniref:helix-turn-helix domain-containing protein n=1 Tax=Guptibacillus hwajinpoensis TaxID=208199 RepID=UPI00273B4526|nr:helix-turn-helix transcriptional regulator [Alkalihalobacillus macyae]MDP4553407.1 helix-turn-helix transcriptional regulator [Alkalihalobacillus macyae]